jgi:hypothetical protein
MLLEKIILLKIKDWQWCKKIVYDLNKWGSIFRTGEAEPYDHLTIFYKIGSLLNAIL